MMTRFALFLILGLATSPLAASGAKWQKLGSKTVKLRAEQDTLLVGAHEGHFDKIKIKVRKNGIHFIDIKVHYANGAIEDFKVKGFIEKGGETRSIDLNGRNRVIKKIVMKYKSNTHNKKGKSLIEVWGRH